MSKFRELVEASLKEWDRDEPDEEWESDNPNDHTGDGEIEWTITLPIDDFHKPVYDMLIAKNYLAQEDLSDLNGKPYPDLEHDVNIEYSIEGYPYDEAIEINKVSILGIDEPDMDITQYINEADKQRIASELEKSGYVEINTEDPVDEWRSDYYHSIL